LRAVRQRLTFPNPTKIAAKRFSRYPQARFDHLPDYVTFYQETEDGLLVPRSAHLSSQNFTGPVNVVEGSVKWPRGNVALSEIQADLSEQALRKLLGNPRWGDALIVAPTACGKTILGVSLAEQLGRRTIVFVHTWAIMKQWVKECETHWGFSPGIIKEGRWEIDRAPLTVAMVQTWIRRRDRWAEAFGVFGTAVADEVHRCPAETMSRPLFDFPTRFKFGLTATPRRQDGLTNVIHAFFGDPIEARVDTTGNAVPIDYLYVVSTPAPEDADDADPKTLALYKLARSDGRADRIVDDVEKAVKTGHSCLVTANTLQVSVGKGRYRTQVPAELPILYTALVRRGITPEVVVGTTKEKERHEIFSAMESGTSRVLLSTTALIQEGANIPRMDRLFITSPTTNATILEQLAGRVRRSHPDKRTVEVYFYTTGSSRDHWKSRHYVAPVFERLGATARYIP